MKNAKRLAALATASVMALSMAGCGASGAAGTASSAASTAESTAASTAETTEAASGEGYTIGFTNSYNGNTYRQAMEGYLNEATAELVASGHVKEVITAEANQDASTQVQQIQNFITQGVDLIIIDPGSATALDGAIQEASDAGIPCIILNDGPVTSTAELCYQMNFDFVSMTYELTKYVCEAIGGTGSIIELRGTAGAESDAQMHEGVLKALAEYPDVTVAAEVYTDWTSSKAQSELASVLPTLDHVDGLVTQGGDAYAAVQAFYSAGYTDENLPIIAGDNRGYFLKWWANEAPEGYDTLSAACNPWDGAMAMYLAVDILDGVTVPNEMDCPIGYVTKDDVAQFSDMDDEAIGGPTFDWDWVKENLEKQG